MKRSLNMYMVAVLVIFMISGTAAIPPERSGSVRGASSRSELSEILSQAIITNDFDMLLNYLPDDYHLEILRSKSPEIEKSIYETINAESIKSRTKENFENVIQSGIDRGINWSSLNMLSNNATKDNNALRRVDTVVLKMEDNREIPLSISFDAMLIAERWFLFQGIRVENEQKELGYAE